MSVRLNYVVECINMVHKLPCKTGNLMENFIAQKKEKTSLPLQPLERQPLAITESSSDETKRRDGFYSNSSLPSPQ